MAVTFVGEFTLGGTMPGAASFSAFAAADLNARLAALIALSAQISATLPSISFSANIDLCLQAIASLEAAIALGISPPAIDAQLSIVAAAVAELELSLAAVAALTLAFSATGVWAYTYSGQADNLGSDFATELASGLPGGGGASENVDAMVLITNVGATWTAIQSIFKTTP